MNEEQVGQETSASIGLRLRGARSLDQMGLNVVHHLVGIHPNSRCAHQTSQLLVGDDEAAILWILQLVVLDVGPHPLDELESRALLNSSEVCQDLVGQEDLLQILVSSVARHGGTSLASERRKKYAAKKNRRAEKSAAAWEEGFRWNDALPDLRLWQQSFLFLKK